MADWLVARTQVGCEKAASERINRLGFETFYPRFRRPIVNRRMRRRDWVSRPLYANYLFVRSPIRHFFLRDVEGIVAVVMTGVVPARSETLDQAIALLHGQLVDGYVVLPEAPPPESEGFRIGETVRIPTGALAGHLGKVFAIKGNRVRLLIKLLAREIPVWYRTQDLVGETTE